MRTESETSTETVVNALNDYFWVSRVGIILEDGRVYVRTMSGGKFALTIEDEPLDVLGDIQWKRSDD